ncbi:MAG TPA: threonine-phosphate decarboxylase CobD [Caulobacteraceae bacterium]|jgi:cobalamin biosynthetic protein CobC
MPACGSIFDPGALAVHGGRLGAARARFAAAPEPWLDLSTGVNPRPYPAPRASAAARARLPDPEETHALELAAARAFGCSPERVLATPGGEAAIRLVAGAIGARTVAIASPTYGGHAAAWREVGAEVLEIPRAQLTQATADVRVLVNPNNPDGAVAFPPTVAALAPDGGWLVVDEAFVEAAPELSVAALDLDRTIVLRSFGKFYGLAGLRLGFIVAAPPLIAGLRGRQGEWPISADALAAGLAAYADAGWGARTRTRLVRGAERLDRLLIGAGLDLVGGISLFRLAAAADATRRFERLASRGVLVRPFAHDARLLRFGLPPAGAWSRLAEALMESRP